MAVKQIGSVERNTSGGLTADDVVMAYCLFFDRDPESVEVVDRHIAQHDSLKTLRTALLRSSEFRTKLPRDVAHMPLDWPTLKVDVDVPAQQLAEMFRLVEGNWEELGRSEPHWSVLASEQFKSTNIEETKINFYQSGKGSLMLITSTAERCGVDLSSLDTCLELGCGVGRVTVWLSQQFRTVIGVDISRPHLSLAETAAQQRGASNVSFLHAGSIQSLRDLPRFDFFYSVIVLQHNPPPVIYAILDALLPKLNPGGVAYFQVPTYAPGYRFAAATYLANAAVRGKMEMHLLPQPALFALFAKHGCWPLEVRENGWAPRMLSNSFLIQKQA